MPNKEYIRIGVFTIDEVLNHIGPYKKDYIGKKVKMGSQRYELFKEKGVVCVKCGLKGEFFALEKQKQPNYQKGEELPDNDRYHFNLYGYNENGEEVMLTKDHIMPKSKGGSNTIDNYQTMCSVCNWGKGNQYDECEELVEIEKKLKKMDNEIIINIEDIKNAPDNSITDVETIRQIALWGIKNNSNELDGKIKKGFEFAGLYPHVMTPYNLKPSILG
jgi:hypothetical protein